MNGFRMFGLAICAALYCLYNGYKLAVYNKPEYDQLRAYDNLQASSFWEKDVRRGSRYFSVYVTGEKTKGSYYYMSNDARALELFDKFNEDNRFKILVDDQRYIWEVYSNGDLFLSYEEVSRGDNINRAIILLKLLASLAVAIFIAYRLVIKEAQRGPESF